PDESSSYLVSAWPAGPAPVGRTVERGAPASQMAPLGGVADNFEARLRATERRALTRRPVGRSTASKLMARADAPRAGDTLSYGVADVSADDPCNRYEGVRAVVKAVGSSSLIVEDISAPAGGFTASDYSAIAAEFDQLVLPTDARWFGTPTDVNGD